MAKTLLYRLFGIGTVPTKLAAELKKEGIISFDEGIRGSVTYIDFRSPGMYSNLKRQWYTASVAVTELRFIAFRYKRTIIDIGLSDEHFSKIQFSLEKDNTLLLSFDPGIFHKNWSGKIEYRFQTKLAESILNKIKNPAV